MKASFLLFLSPLAILYLTSAARADMLYLTCTSDLGPAVITFDLSGQTVNGIHAMITPTAIEWDIVQSAPVQATTHWDINRISGSFTAYTYVGGGTLRHAGTCAAGPAPATKF